MPDSIYIISSLSVAPFKIKAVADMKIIKNNYLSMKVTCGRCRSELEIDANDINDSFGYYYTCGACKKTNTILSNEIPKQILREIDEDY